MKKQYYFAHKAYMRHDSQITKMRNKYKSQGYGWYWILMELLRESDEYRLPISRDDDIGFIADQFCCHPRKAKAFIDECCDGYRLFIRRDGYLYNDELLTSMKKMEEKSDKASIAAKSRWEGNPLKTSVEQENVSSGVPYPDAVPHANAYIGKEMKGDKIKEDDMKVKETIKEQNKGYENRLEKNKPNRIRFGNCKPEIDHSQDIWMDFKTFKVTNAEKEECLKILNDEVMIANYLQGEAMNPNPLSEYDGSVVKYIATWFPKGNNSHYNVMDLKK